MIPLEREGRGIWVSVHPAEESDSCLYSTFLVSSTRLQPGYKRTYVPGESEFVQKRTLDTNYQSGRPHKLWKYQDAQENLTELRGAGTG